jgi:hypothetical protein
MFTYSVLSICDYSEELFFESLIIFHGLGNSSFNSFCLYNLVDISFVHIGHGDEERIPMIQSSPRISSHHVAKV